VNKIKCELKFAASAPDQPGQAIANLGATALGFILVPSSPRYVKIEQINAITSAIPDKIDFIGVFADEQTEIIQQIIVKTPLTSVQLHGRDLPNIAKGCGNYYPPGNYQSFTDQRQRKSGKVSNLLQ
jgi:phosphoribosylanthranilate isomerase